jgi:hypothetical protein
MFIHAGGTCTNFNMAMGERQNAAVGAQACSWLVAPQRRFDYPHRFTLIKGPGHIIIYANR